MIRVAHVINDLDRGGAEMVLLKLMVNRDAARFEPLVISLSGDGVVADELAPAGVPVDSFRMGSALATPLAISWIGRRLRRFRPAVVQTWMYQADLVGGLAARMFTRAPVVWGLHATGFPAGRRSIEMRLGLPLARRLSSIVPTRIIACAETARAFHVALGYDAARMMVIPNGFEIPESTRERAGARKELGLPSGRFVVARVGRDHPQKDQETLYRAMDLLISAGNDVHLVVVGAGLGTSAAGDAEGRYPSLRGRTTFLGPRRDVSEVYGSADLTVSSSAYGEALPLVIGESMARGVPVVTTDVGDSGALIGDDDRVVPPKDPRALAAAVERILRLNDDEREALGARDRRRVAERYSVDAMVRAYEGLYETLSRSPRRASAR